MALQLPGTGPHRFWGFSPSYDTRDPMRVPGVPGASDGASARHVALLLCPGDVRHVLHTLASAHSTDRPEADLDLTFHVYEEHPEVLARQILLLSIALDFEMPRRERAEIFLEVMGNTMIRERSALYVASRARELRRLLAREEGPLVPHIDLGCLKMKERDALEDALATWQDGVEFDVVRLRDERLRGYYKDRYDHRRNVLDWDYSMGLVETAPVIHRIHFREWRLSGLAFEVRDAAYNTPNRSLASSAAGRQQGASVLKRGFWGDVVNSPFAAVGVECDDARFFAKRSEQVVKTACDVAYYNVVGWLTRLETGRPFAVKLEDFDDFAYGASVGHGGLAKGFLRAELAGPRPKAQVQAALLEEAEELGLEADAAAAAAASAADAAAATAEEARVRQQVASRRMAALPKFKLVLHTGKPLELFSRAKLAGACSHVHIASHAAHLLAAPLARVLTAHAVVAVEGARFLVEVHKDAKQRLAVKLAELGALAGLEPLKAAAELSGAHDSLVVLGFDRALETERRAAAADKYRAGSSTGAPAADAAEEATSAAGPLGELTIDEAAAPAADPESAEAGAAPLVAREPRAQPEPPRPPAAPDAIGTSNGRVCAITGLPAKYRDPVTGAYYANAQAFKELRRRAAGAPADDATPGAMAIADGPAVEAGDVSRELPPDDVIRPKHPALVVSSGGTTRRLNKVA